MRRVRYMIIKEFKQIFRDKPMLALIFVVPVIQLLVLSFAVSAEVTNLPVLIIDLDRSSYSREIVKAFDNTKEFNVIGKGGSLKSIKEMMKSWKIAAAVVVPEDFERDCRRGNRPAVEIALDGVDNQTSNLAFGFATGLISRLSRSLSPMRIEKNKKVVLRERIWYNVDLRNRQYMVPGVVVVLLTILPMMLAGMSLVKEKEVGTLEQLRVTPLNQLELVGGKLVPLLILSYGELLLVTFVATRVFSINMAGDYFTLGVIALIYLFTTIGLGIFSSAITETQQQAMFVAWFFMVFMILLSGFFVPLENMPETVKKITYLNPARYFMTVVRDIFQKGSDFRELWREVWPLSLLGAGILGVSLFKMKK